MLRRGDGETQRQMRFSDTKLPERLSASFFGRTAAPSGGRRFFQSVSHTNNLPLMTRAGLEPATYGLKERTLVVR
jgi:hypothetical protein